MEQLRLIVKFFLSLVVNPEQTWQYLSDPSVREADVDYVQRNYYLPMMGAIAVVVFILTGIHFEPFNLEHAMKASVAFLVAFFAGPYVAEFILQHFMVRFYDTEPDKQRLQLFVYYTLSYEMGVQLVSRLMPSIRFADLLVVYLAYIVWCASAIFFGIEERRRLSFSIWTTVILFITHWSIVAIMQLMGR